MSEDNDVVKSWRRTCIILGMLLAFSGAAICALIAILVMRSTAHQLEIKTLRAQNERDRETLTKMWQASDDALKREQAARAQSIKK